MLQRDMGGVSVGTAKELIQVLEMYGRWMGNCCILDMMKLIAGGA